MSANRLEVGNRLGRIKGRELVSDTIVSIAVNRVQKFLETQNDKAKNENNSMYQVIVKQWLNDFKAIKEDIKSG